ncbi:Uncharacterised protein [Escherichia coli]|uniref:Uncharacterized protein n=1 Tax=Escherichia coli TaxID=562 RepID=A0A377HEW2_ECOLX|nr:Uncharacterised protein [Escherichia coli]
MLTQTIFPCLLKKQENIIPEVSNTILLSSTVTTDGYTVFNKQKQPYTNCKYLLPTERKS